MGIFLFLNGSRRAGRVVAIGLTCAAALLAACQATPRLQPRIAEFDWQFKKIMDNAPDQQVTFRTCDRASRDRARFIMDYEEQVSRYTVAMISCMRIEGWGITKPPMRFVTRTPAITPAE